MTAFPPQSPSSPPGQPASDGAEMTRQCRELTVERDALEKKLADCTRLLQASTNGLISLDKAGLIESANPRAVEMLGTDRVFLLKKSISMFITPEDQSVFYINRTRIFSGEQKAPFEINLKKKDGTVWSARISARPIETPNQQLPGMLMAIEDISSYRQAVESLQFQEDFVNLLFSILDDLAVWSTADIDEVIIYSLEKIGLVSGADRVYVCLFHDHRTRLTITHEWSGDTVDSPAAALQGAAVGDFTPLIDQAKKRNTVAVEDIKTLPADIRRFHERFHAPGVRALLYAPLFHGRYLLGIIGCETVRKTIAWSIETQQLVKCVGGAIVNTLLRRQAEKMPAKIREAMLQFVAPEPATKSEEPFEYEGPIEVIDSEPSPAPPGEARWRIEAGEPGDSGLLETVLLKDGSTAKVACRNCNHQRLIKISEIRTLGTQLKVTCVCGNEMFFKVDLRREHRKRVRLEGFFIRGPDDRIAPTSDNWGRILISNLSRSGIGFKIIDKHDIRVEDRFRVKFNLDNTARSTVQKEVIVRSAAADIIGCEFTGNDPSDVTLGFYMMT